VRRLKLWLEYNGTNYHGWQRQPNTVTVQGTVEACLGTITNHAVRLQAAGRTDAGVHALGQVAHFDTASTLAVTTLQRGLNSLLPADIVVLRVEETTAAFHARFSAVQKTYAYVIRNHVLRSAFQVPFSWYIPYGLDVPAMRQAARVLVGRHDFSAFRAASCGARHAVRHLTHLAIKRRGARLFFVLRADGFLQYMVRNIVGTLVEVGRGKLPPGCLADILQSRQRQRAGPTAPAHGLFLVRVSYFADSRV
jgi:tRNA pseudouridine38-40 synthase